MFIEKTLNNLEAERVRILTNPKMSNASKSFHVNSFLRSVNLVIQSLEGQSQTTEAVGQLSQARILRAGILDTLDILEN